MSLIDKKKVEEPKQEFKILKIFKKTKKNQEHKLKGGQLLGEGGFGCVISPPLKCSKTFLKLPYSIDKNYISKIIEYDENEDDVWNELNIGKLLLKIDPNQKYFSPIINGCFLDKQRNKDLKYLASKPNKHSQLSNSLSSSNSDNNKTKKLKKCNIYLDEIYLNLLSKNAGINFDDVFQSDNQNLHNYIEDNYKYIFNHFCKGLSLLHKHNILQSDIKSLNLMCNYSETTGNARMTFIDFGLSEILENKHTLRDLFYFCSKGTDLYKSPEIIILCEFIDLLNKDKKQFSKTKVLDNVLKIYKSNRYYYKKELNLHFSKLGVNLKNKDKLDKKDSAKYCNNSDILKVYNKIIDDYNNNILVDKFIEDKHIYKWDVFSLGLFFAELSYKYNLEDKLLFDLINKMVHPFYWERYTIKQCLEHPFFTIAS